MTTKLTMLQVSNLQEWRSWLGKHHTSSPGIWLVFCKDHTGVKSIPYEEALCFGWVESLVKRLDEERYARKFTPRRPTSKWSDTNRKRCMDLTAAGLLKSAGLVAAPTDNTYVPRAEGPSHAGLHR